MKRKIIYLSFVRLTDKISRDWYIDYCIERGANVEYWDIVSLVREDHEEVGSLNVDYLKYINSFDEFVSLIRQSDNQEAIYIMLVAYAIEFLEPYRLLTKYSCRMVFLNWGAMPISPPETKFRRVIDRLTSDPIKLIKSRFGFVTSYIYRKLNLVKKYDIVFVAGSVLNLADQYARKKVNFNLCDFDHFRRLSNDNKRLVQYKYAVFLDINLPYQSDLAIAGLPAVNANDYYNSLNRFFDLIEISYGLKVVIASHPKAHYQNYEYKNREIYRLVTAELVKDAQFVITHTSTAISYAVLNYKSIIFVYTNEMKTIYKHTVLQEIRGLSNFLNSDLYNVDEVADCDQINIKAPNRDLYDLYKYRYLTSPESENFRSAEIFWNNINAL